MGFLFDFSAYIVYLFAVGVAALVIYAGYYRRSNQKIVNDFFAYVHKGRGRHGSMRKHIGLFFLMQLVFPLFAFSLQLWEYFTITLLLYIGYSHYATDAMKRHRHNGIRIGFEYAHPVKAYDAAPRIAADGTIIRKVVTAGSKGYYDLNINQPNPHMMIIGESGVGKSTTQEGLLIRSYEKFGVYFLIIDWNDSYRDLKGHVNTWIVPKNLRINPFALRGMDPGKRAGIASEVLQVALDLTPMQMQRVREMLNAQYESTGEPTIQDLHKAAMEEAEKEHMRELRLQWHYIANKFTQLFGIFGEEPKEFWNNYRSTCSIVELEGLTDAEKVAVTHTIVQRITEEFGRGRGRLNIALDDAYKALEDYHGNETLIARIVREGRKYGFGMVISTQQLRDIPESVISNTAVKFIHAYHNPYDKERVHTLLDMSELEKNILYRMPKGMCFLFDLYAIQKGKVRPAFIEVDKVTEEERKSFSKGIKRIDINGIQQKEGAKARAGREKSMYEITKEAAPPDVAVYRFIVALRDAGSVTAAHGFLKSSGWITSTSTLYGGRDKPSLLERAVSGRYIEREGRFLEKGSAMINPERMIEAQGIYKGSEVHKRLMAATIRLIQKDGDFAFVPEKKDGFDVGRIPVSRKVKGWWDYENITIYEVQRDADEKNIKKCMNKAKRYKAKLVIVTDSEKVEEEAREIGKGEIEAIRIEA